MENAVPEKRSPFATEPIGRLIVKFAVPSVIALLVNSLYNIVDQIFIGNGVGYLGNGATNIVFPITIVMALTNNLLAQYGAQSIYGSDIPLTATGIVMKVNQIMISILLGIATGAQPIIGFNYGAMNFNRVKKALEISLIASEIVSVLAFLLFQFAPMSVISLFGSEDALYNEFAIKAFRIFLMLCPLTGFQTVIAVYLQAVGKPIKSAILSLARQIIFFVPAALLLPRTLGVEGVLWTGPVADGLAFIKDKRRAAYHRFYTDMKWGHAQNYDLTLNSGTLGLDKCVEIIKSLY